MCSDRAWLDGYRRRERSADERVFRTYVGLVTTIVSGGVALKDGRRVPGVAFDLQQDLIHDAFMRVFSASARLGYDGLRPFGFYVGQIARNILIDHYRAMGTQKRDSRLVADDVDASDIADDAPLPDRLALQEEQEEQMRSFLGSLSSEDRAFVKIRFEEAKSQKETARALQITRHRVRTLDSKIQAALAAFLATVEEKK